MSEDLTNRGASARARININQEHERRDWAKSLAVTRIPEASQTPIAIKGPPAPTQY
jgi:hypothetical protein